MDVEMKALLSPAVTPYNYALQSRTSLPCHEVLSYHVMKHFLATSRSTAWGTGDEGWKVGGVKCHFTPLMYYFTMPKSLFEGAITDFFVRLCFHAFTFHRNRLCASGML